MHRARFPREAIQGGTQVVAKFAIERSLYAGGHDCGDVVLRFDFDLEMTIAGGGFPLGAQHIPLDEFQINQRQHFTASRDLERGQETDKRIPIRDRFVQQ